MKRTYAVRMSHAPTGSHRGGAGGGPAGRGLTSRADPDALRAQNAAAPYVPGLWKRVGAMFVPYRKNLMLTAALVLTASAASVIPPLLVQRLFDQALFPADGAGGTLPPRVGVLTGLVALMIGIFITSAGLSVWQTWVTSNVGNRVTGDLRVTLFDKLQRMELAFFTRTKTGVIQSRLQNDVGGVAGVLTTFVSSIVGNTATVVASLVAMIGLDWRLTLLAVVLMPALVVAQRRVGLVRQRIAAKTQESLSELTSITQETLSVSGILLSKVYNRRGFESERYAGENKTLIRLQIQQAMNGQ